MQMGFARPETAFWECSGFRVYGWVSGLAIRVWVECWCLKGVGVWDLLGTNVDPLPLFGVVIRILILRPLKGGGLLIMGLH